MSLKTEKNRAALAALQVIDRLEVGPPKVEEARVVVPYTVVKGRKSDAMDLIFKWEEPVFDPDEPASLNLAAMIGAQPALNYGLFCKEIDFKGSFDAHDRRFLGEMARNTAREIYVNKLLMPNRFLVREIAGLPRTRVADFLSAKILFGKAPATTDGVWSGRKDRYAILSSGGKDSLLTHGLLNEMGLENHPLFANESGRHWYTALNAYRYFKAHVPNTARVWLNSDRLFAWMLRHLPFIRPDFANLRSDDYPIRLWTVAVFLFGTLPLLRKRGVGRLLIGDEFDTTVRSRHGEIAHYAGLYDQSRYFDERLTRYFQRKHWQIAQFSLLRPMSELLIQKTFVERYPALQEQQMSCHATHIDDGRVYPCGKCEKCRRIVGMLVASGSDPKRCGYRDEQIASALSALGESRLHQERACSEHLLNMLAAKEKLSIDARLVRSARSHPEVLSLRFDPTRSPIDCIPNDLREPLYRILLEHAEGALRRSGKVWLGFDPLDEATLSEPYRFEKAVRGHSKSPEDADRGKTYLLAELTWPEAKERLKEVDIALLPVGSIEQHGRHLPLDVDAYDADRLSRLVAESCSEPKPLVLPLIPYGVSYHHDGFSGTISISPATLSQLVCDVGMSAAKQGITKLVIVNGHGGNSPALQFAAQMINRDAHIFTCVDTGESSDTEIEKFVTTRNDVHAGEIETSTALASRPHLVKMDLARRSVPRFSSEYLEFSSTKRVEWHMRIKRISKDGVLGDPTRATAEKGQLIWQVMIRNLVELVEDLKSMTLDEIYQRRL